MARALPPGVEVRAIHPEEMDQFGWVNSIVFAEHQMANRDATRWMQPEWTTCVFEHGEMATTFGAWPFSMRFNGARIAIAGVTTVGTLPMKRRRGFLRLAMERALAEQRDRGQALAALYASQAAIYRRYGYAVASQRCRYELDPQDLVFVNAPTPAGSVRLTDSPDMETLQSLYRTFSAPRHGLLHRGAALWEANALAKPPEAEGPVNVAIYEEEGKPRGYLIYTNADHPWPPEHTLDRGQRMQIREMAWLGPAAYVSLWQYVAGHDLVYRVLVNNAPEDDPILVLARDPRRLRRHTSDGLLVRIVDLENALPVRPYGAEDAFTIQVEDEICEWNAGAWRIETAAIGAHVARADGATPDLQLTAHDLATLAFGYASATALHRAGMIEVADEAVLPRLDRAFATSYRPHCMDNF